MHLISLVRINTSCLQVLSLSHLLILIISFGLAFKIHVKINDNINPMQTSYPNIIFLLFHIDLNNLLFDAIIYSQRHVLCSILFCSSLCQNHILSRVYLIHHKSYMIYVLMTLTEKRDEGTKTLEKKYPLTNQ
jgi:hypothetical protein